MSTSHLSVRNPRTGQHDYEIELPSTDEIQASCLRLRSGQKDWFQAGLDHRIQVLQDWKKAILAHESDIIEALSHDTGRYHESVLEAKILSDSIDRWCKISKTFFAMDRHKETAVPFIHIEQDEVPYELVGVISPWNFPLLLSIIDAIPALLAGCAVVVKPSEVTPRFIEPLMDTIREVPELEAIFQYIAGDGRTGAALLSEIDLVCFTGSVATGQKVYHACADLFIPCFLELGGKDAALVFEGANLDHASASILWGSTVNCGHSCLSIERVYVQEVIFDTFLEKLVARAREVNLAVEDMKSGQIGPVISDRQVAIIDDHLQDALEKGATLIHGVPACQKINGGYWCPPTILTGVTHDMKIMTEETFGPIIPVMAFHDEASGLMLANGTVFGLSGAVFAGTTEEAIRIARQMDAGALSINDCALTAIIHEGEKNSFKMSGIGGTRMGPGAIRRFMRQRAFIIKNQPVASPWWF